MSHTDALEANLLALVNLVGDLQRSHEALKTLYLELSDRVVEQGMLIEDLQSAVHTLNFPLE